MAAVWEQTGPPLRPSPESVAAYHHFAREWIALHGAPRVLLLGVTPELYRMDWPDGHDFIAVDHTPAAIERVWPGPKEKALEAGWLDLPLPAGSRDLVLCDGGLHLLDHPAGQHRLVEQLYEVLAPGGRCLFRLFEPPADRESPDAVLADLFAGRVENLNVLKLRLGWALQQDADEGVALQTLWRALRTAGGEWAGLADRLGWSLEHLRVIDTYRDSPASYYFITGEQAAELFCGGGLFVPAGRRDSANPPGVCCPVLAFDRH